MEGESGLRKLRSRERFRENEGSEASLVVIVEVGAPKAESHENGGKMRQREKERFKGQRSRRK